VKPFLTGLGNYGITKFTKLTEWEGGLIFDMKGMKGNRGGFAQRRYGRNGGQAEELKDLAAASSGVSGESLPARFARPGNK